VLESVADSVQPAAQTSSQYKCDGRIHCKTLHLKAGDPIVEVVDKWHYGKNTGTGPATIVISYAGTMDTPTTIKK
jgi:hypothetical protein